jgi:TPR repeat protein
MTFGPYVAGFADCTAPKRGYACRPRRYSGTTHVPTVSMVRAALFSDVSDAQMFRQAVWNKARDRHFALTHDKEVLDRDPDRDALREAQELWRNDPEAAIPILRGFAEGGSAWSAMLLGYAYERGTGVGPDLTEAERWYRSSIEGRCRQALLRLGRIFENGGDLAAAERIYAVGVAERWAPAIYTLARLKLRHVRTPVELEEGRSLLEQAAAQDDLLAQMHLAALLTRGRFGWWRIPSGLRLLWRTGSKLQALEGKSQTL